MGFEPTTLGTTIQCSNQLSYIHHLKKRAAKIIIFKTERNICQNFLFIFVLWDPDFLIDT